MSYTNTYKFAETVVRVTYESEYITKQCKDYISDETPEFEITLDAVCVEYERERADSDGYSYGYLESLAFYRRFCSDIVNKNIIDKHIRGLFFFIYQNFKGFSFWSHSVDSNNISAVRGSILTLERSLC